MMIKNRVADLTEDQLKLVLEGEERKKDRGFVGVTLGKFIEENHLKDATLTRLYEEMQFWHLKWPFFVLNVSVEVKKRRMYSLGVLDEAIVEEYKAGRISLTNIDPDFSIDKAYNETIHEYPEGYYEGDYAVTDSYGHTLLARNN